MNYKIFSHYTFWIAVMAIFFHSCSKVSSPVSQDSEVNELIEKGLGYYDSAAYDAALNTFEEARLRMGTEIDTVALFRILINATEIYKRRGNYDKCLNNYYQALNLVTLLKDTARMGLAHYNLSSVYYHLQLIDKAEEHNQMAQNYYIVSKQEARLTNSWVQMAVLKRTLMNHEAARVYLHKAIEYYTKHKDTMNLSICINNIGNILVDEQKHGDAISYYQKSATLLNSYKYPYGSAIRLGNISEVFYELGALDSCKYYLDSSMAIATRVDAKETMLLNYRRLVNYYYAQKELDSVMTSMQELYDINTKLLSIEADEVVKSLEDKYKNELALERVNNQLAISEKDRQLALLTSWTMVLVLVLVLVILANVYLLYIRQQKIRKQEAALHQKEKSYLEAQNELKALQVVAQEEETKRIQEELNYKKQELLKFSVNLKEKSEFVEELKNLFEQLDMQKKPDVSLIKKLNILLQNNVDENQLAVDKRIEEINSDFAFKLKLKHPNLKDDDIRLASLILLDLSSKEIADIINITPKSVDMKKYRLKKKMNLETSQDFKEYLLLFN